MNIFVTHCCPVLSAQALDDKRVLKMVVETAQLLSGALNNLGYWSYDLYKPTHTRHPCTLWAGKSRGNFRWLVNHGRALAEEYKHRYNGRTHKSLFVINKASERFESKCPLPELGMTPFANCTNITGNISTVSKYRRYMIQSKWSDGKASWTNRERPKWYK